MNGINWNGVMQSILDTWLPIFGGIIIIVIVPLAISFIRKRKK